MKFCLTSPKSGGRSVDIVHSRTKATQLLLLLVALTDISGLIILTPSIFTKRLFGNILRVKSEVTCLLKLLSRGHYDVVVAKIVHQEEIIFPRLEIYWRFEELNCMLFFVMYVMKCLEFCRYENPFFLPVGGPEKMHHHTSNASSHFKYYSESDRVK
jgi:hypothetical protein